MIKMNGKTYQNYINNIGTKIKQDRINAGLTQQDLEAKSGVSSRSISRLEQGASVQLESLVKILIALKLDSNIELLIPDQTKRPSYYLKDNEMTRQRVRKKVHKNDIFKWGDEE